MNRLSLMSAQTGNTQGQRSGAVGPSDEPSPRSLTVVANRLPVEVGTDGSMAVSPGGLVAALSCAIGPGDRWIGWLGTSASSPTRLQLGGLDLRPVPLADDEVEQYYGGFANSVLWPLFHGRLRNVEFDREWWRAYRRVNARFAAAAAKAAPYGSTVWVHDYHLLLAPRFLRRRRPDLRIGLFLHIPFPNAQLFASLPWRREILTGMLGADLVGFQVADDADNFLAAVERCTTHVIRRFDAHGGHAVGDATRRVVMLPTHSTTVGAFPISIDFDHWDRLGADVTDRARQLRDEVGARTLLLGVDRLDYTKGIALRIRAFGELLDEGALVADDTVLVQVAVPSRSGIADYDEERAQVEAAVAEVNERHRTADGRPAVRYLHQSLDERELAGWYRAADVLIVTSLADGMNLVAKEFVATRSDRRGAVVLSEFAGAVHDLADGAVVVNPFDIDAIKRATMAAVHLDEIDQAARMDAMRTFVRRNDVHRWADDFLGSLVVARPRRRSVG